MGFRYITSPLKSNITKCNEETNYRTYGVQDVTQQLRGSLTSALLTIVKIHSSLLQGMTSLAKIHYDFA